MVLNAAKIFNLHYSTIYSIIDIAHVEKLLKKMQINMLDWKIEHFETIAKHFDVEVTKTSGSHVIFRHGKWTESLSVPAHRPIKPIYVKKFLKLIIELDARN